MKIGRMLAAVGACAVGASSGVAWAQDEDGGFMMEEVVEEEKKPIFTNEVEVGVGFNTEDSFKFGEYTGLTDEGPFFIGNFDLLYRSDWQSDDTTYVRGYGNDLGLDSREAYIEYGQQGRFNLNLEYDEIPHNLIEDARTPYRGEGGANLTLPPNFNRATDAAAMNLNATNREIDIENERERYGGGLGVLFGPNWSFDVDYRREEREGTRQTFGVFGINGGNPAAVALPEPVDYETDEITGTVAYTTDRLQAQFAYDGSFFNQNNESLRWDSAWSGSPGSPWDAVPNRGQMSLPPDNQAHHFSFSGGYNLGQTSRVSGKLLYGIATQDETFLPYTINPLLTVSEALPRNSLDGEVETLFGDLRFTTRPTQETDLRAEYRYEERDNNTPRDVFQYAPGDTGDQGAIDTSLARINFPYSFAEHEFDLVGGYRFAGYTKLSVGYNFERIERDFSERDYTNEHTGRVRLRGRPLDNATAWLEYSHGERTGDDYDDNAPFLSTHTPQFLATLNQDEQFENHPALRKTNLADRSRDRVKASGTYTATRDLAFTATGGLTYDDYDDSELGVQEQLRWHAGLDANYIVSPRVTTYAFYTYEQFNDELRGHSFRPFPPTLGSLTDPGQRWTKDSTDRINTVGAGVEWTAVPDKLTLGLDYTFSHANTSFDFAAGSELRPISDPSDLESTLHQIDVSADYQVEPMWRVRLGYRFEYFDTNDFATDGVGQAALGDVVNFATSSPDYTAHVIGVSVVATF